MRARLHTNGQGPPLVSRPATQAEYGETSYHASPMLLDVLVLPSGIDATWTIRDHDDASPVVTSPWWLRLPPPRVDFTDDTGTVVKSLLGVPHPTAAPAWLVPLDATENDFPPGRYSYRAHRADELRDPIAPGDPWPETVRRSQWARTTVGDGPRSPSDLDNSLIGSFLVE